MAFIDDQGVRLERQRQRTENREKDRSRERESVCVYVIERWIEKQEKDEKKQADQAWLSLNRLHEWG